MAKVVSIRGRKYGFYAKRGSFYAMDVSMDTYLSKKLKEMGKEVPKAIHSGLRKIGYVGHMYMKKDARRGMGPMENWPDRSIVTRRFPRKGGMRLTEASPPGKARSFYGRMWRAIAYDLDAMPRQEVEFGFLGRAAYYLGTRLQRGFIIKMTPKMRRMFLYRGFKAPKGDLKIPARNFITPSYKAHFPMLLKEFDLEVRRVWNEKMNAQSSRKMK